MVFHPEWLLPIFLYAETHYKFKGIYSRLIKKEPEILADAPFRVEKGHKIPVLLFIKDAHRYPVELQYVEVELAKNDAKYFFKFDFNGERVEQKFYHRIFWLNVPAEYSGMIYLNVTVQVKIGGKIRRYVNDNYRISSHQPLQVYFSEAPLPRLENLYLGDIHWHSTYTDDMVEFGAPIPAAVEMAKAIGLDFFAVTDHSYDLDDEEDNWLKNDHTLPKWQALKNEIDDLNAKEDNFVIIPGEEVSAGNSKNKNVHLLLLNSREFFPGKGDGAERWLRNKPDMKIPEILDQLEDEALAIAGHPEIPFPLIQKIFLRRGDWQPEDFEHKKLSGFQIWNGELDHSFYGQMTRWHRLLLDGKRLALFAGNDAHGNFNRFRQIGFPFFTLIESENQVFGKMRTGVIVEDKLNLENLLMAMKKGRTIVSNGPVGIFSVHNDEGKNFQLGDKVFGSKAKIEMEVRSSEDYGALKSIQLFHGDIPQKKEIEIFNFEPSGIIFEWKNSIEFRTKANSGYFRLQIISQKKEQQFRCMTSPIYFER